MITNKPEEVVNLVQTRRQRLGNKTFFNTLTTNANNQAVRYFSSVDAEIYFEDVFIDECVQINWTVQQQSLPLFGYNSYVYDDLALGSRLVNGQFTINFTKCSYMYEVLDTLTAMKNNNKGSFTKYIDQHAPLWNKSFDIYVSYGDARQDNRIKGSTIIVLKECNLLACNQDLDYTGKPIYETYQFIARDIDFLTEGNTVQPIEEVVEEVEQLKDPIESAIVELGMDSDAIFTTFNFNEGYIIKSIMYRIDVSASYIEAELDEDIITENQSTFKDVDTDEDNIAKYIEFYNAKIKEGDTTSRYLEAIIEYETYNGETNTITQKLRIL